MGGNSIAAAMDERRPLTEASKAADQEDDLEVKVKERWTFPRRYLVAVVGALGLLPIVGTRKCFALVLTHITAAEGVGTEELLFTNCSVFNSSHDARVEMGGDTMFLLHATYYAGSPILNIAGSVLATVVSPISVITAFVLTSSLITLALPFVVTRSVPAIFCLRLLQGAVDGIQQPCSTGVLSAWSTDGDRAALFSIYFTGAYLAPAIAALLSAATLCYVSWHSAIFIYGSAGVVWSVVWWFSIYPTPQEHPSLPRGERLLHLQHGVHVKTSSQTVRKAIPWRHIVTSPPVWSVFVGFFCHTFVYSMLVVEQAQYLFDSFHIDISDIGLLTTLPHVGLSVSCIAGGFVSDKLLHRCGFSVTVTRKLLFSIGKCTEGACLLGLCFTSDWRVAVCLITLGVTVGGLAEAGYHPIPADLAPQYAAVIAGFVSMGAIGAFVNTVIASFVCGRSKTLGDWQKLFLVCGLLDLFAVVFFNLTAKAELQPWASGCVDLARDDCNGLVSFQSLLQPGPRTSSDVTYTVPSIVRRFSLSITSSFSSRKSLTERDTLLAHAPAKGTYRAVVYEAVEGNCGQ